MSINFSFFNTLLILFGRFVLKYFRIPKPKSLNRSISSIHASQSKYQKYTSLLHRASDLSNKTLIFNMEEALLKSPSFFSYFMLVAFEAGGLIRSFLLFALYPFICLTSEEMGLKIMVMISFCGIKKESFRVGRAVLPKFFLESVGFEMFQVLKKGDKTIGLTNFPQVMVENFLSDYLEIDFVVGREMKVLCGYYVGLMENKGKEMMVLDDIIVKENISYDNVIGITSVHKFFDSHMFSHCKEIYLLKELDKRSWEIIPPNKYPKPLIFHDGRLALTPTPLTTLVMFMWIPLGLTLSLTRLIVGLTLPFNLSLPIIAFTGLRMTVATPNHKKGKTGILYVCNHRTLLDPLALSFALKQKNLTAVTYSLSRVSEILAPIRTVRLKRNKETDGAMMKKLLDQGDLVVCPEGTTCREPFLLRFSPLFTEMSDVIIPVAVDADVSMFYGTTASGLKCLDPVFFLMDPMPRYTVRYLEPVSGLLRCRDRGDNARYEVANHVQSEIAKELGFKCTNLTRKDKYLILAGNNGVVGGNKQ